MSKGGASVLVLVSGGILVALALIPGNAGEDTYKRIWAAGLWTISLGVAADFVPSVVAPFAVLIIIASVVKHPGVLGGFLGGGSSSPQVSSGSAAQGAAAGSQSTIS